MIILAVDTSGPVCGVSVRRDGNTVYEAAAVNKMTHSVSLLPMCEEALTRSGLDISDVDLFAAVTGPGSFTGVRIGVSCVKGMAHGAGKPCTGVNALEALAAGLPLAEGMLLCPIQDARAGQVYGAAFLPGLPPVRVMNDRAQKLEDFLAEAQSAAAGRRLCLLGDGVKPNLARIKAALGEDTLIAPETARYLRPANVAALAETQPEMDYLQLMPIYLRAPQAERERARKLEGQA